MFARSIAEVRAKIDSREDGRHTDNGCALPLDTEGHFKCSAISDVYHQFVIEPTVNHNQIQNTYVRMYVCT